MSAPDDVVAVSSAPADLALAIRKEEIAAQAKQQELQHDFAVRALDAQSIHQREMRAHVEVLNRRGMWIIFALFMSFLVVVLAAFYLNKEAVVLEAMKYIFTFLGGGGVGYGVRAMRNVPQAPQIVPPQQ